MARASAASSSRPSPQLRTRTAPPTSTPSRWPTTPPSRSCCAGIGASGSAGPTRTTVEATLAGRGTALAMPSTTSPAGGGARRRCRGPGRRARHLTASRRDYRRGSIPSPSQRRPTVSTAAVILAAGKGTRFKSELPKVLHRAAGRTLLRHVLEAVRPLGCSQVVVVVGHGRDQVVAELDAAGIDEVTTVVQERQLGTGHAVEIAMPALADDVHRVLVLPGDTPLITADALEALLEPDDDVELLSGVLDDATRLRPDRARRRRARPAPSSSTATPRRSSGRSASSTPACTSSTGRCWQARSRTSTPTTTRASATSPTSSPSPATAAPPWVPPIVDAELVAGVNDRVQLAEVSSVLRHRRMEELGRDGVTILDPVLDLDRRRRPGRPRHASCCPARCSSTARSSGRAARSAPTAAC